jgi:hypothetical protein
MTVVLLIIRPLQVLLARRVSHRQPRHALDLDVDFQKFIDAPTTVWPAGGRTEGMASLLVSLSNVLTAATAI